MDSPEGSLTHCFATVTPIPSGAEHRSSRLNWLNRLVVGCECNRPTHRSIQEAGFEQLDHFTLPKSPKFVRLAIVGKVTAPMGAARPEPQVI